MDKTPVEILVADYGSKTKIGQILGIKRGAVSAWGDFVPPEHAITFEKITNGKYKAVELVKPVDIQIILDRLGDAA